MFYRAPAWLPGGHLQTIWPARYARRTLGPLPAYRRERWDTLDGDFIDVDWLGRDHDGHEQRANFDSAKNITLLVLFHGLEGSSSSHYAQSFAGFALRKGLIFAMPHFRGCSGEINRAPRAYHSGDHDEIQWLLSRFRAQHKGPIVAAGVSLGGNALMRWAGEAGREASGLVSAVASICSPLDLTASGHAMGKGFNRQVYTRMFLRSMKPKAMLKLAQHPGLFDVQAMQAARDLNDFDNIFTAPLHGFKNTQDYWARASAKPHLHRIRIPALALNARNDPFVPASSLPLASDVSEHVTLWQPEHGGHVGFPQGYLPPGNIEGLPENVGAWLMEQVARHG